MKKLLKSQGSYPNAPLARSLARSTKLNFLKVHSYLPQYQEVETVNLANLLSSRELPELPIADCWTEPNAMQPGETISRSPLDKPIHQLTEDDISQLTREDCRRYLKEKGL